MYLFVAGVGLNKYPVQFGRPFVPGQIKNFPQAVINGVTLATQADVKQRWDDGSVRHAVISFILESLPAGGSVTCVPGWACYAPYFHANFRANVNSSLLYDLFSVNFQNQASGDGGGAALTMNEMLDPAFNFDAVIELTNTTTVSASARTLLAAGKASYWTSGAICTTVIIADHSLDRTGDIGFDSLRSFRPVRSFFMYTRNLTVGLFAD